MLYNITNNNPEMQNKVEMAELAAILKSMPDALYIGDITGIKISNQLALDMLGFESAEELNQNIALLADRIKTRDFKTGKRLARDEEPFARALMGETVTREVLTTHIKSNKEVIVRCAAAPVMVDGQVVGAIAINSDITEHVSNKQLTQKAIEELKRKNEALDKFVYITSHDLKAPLHSITSLLDILRNEFGESLAKEGLEILNMAITKVNSMNELIHSLLATAMNEEKVKEPIDVLQLVSSMVRNLNLPKSVNVYINHNLPVIIYHKVSLGQIFQNILSNAIKFTDKTRGIIKIDCDEKEDAYIFSINDNGSGIRKEELDTIFRKFHIGHTDPAKDSSGLGLAIVKDIIEENHGKIWAESTLGQGTTFYFTIPKT